MIEASLIELEDKDVAYLIGMPPARSESEVEYVQDIVREIDDMMEEATIRLMPYKIEGGEVIEINREDLEEAIND